METGYFILAGAATGAAASMLSTYFFEKARAARKVKSLRAILRCEVVALLDLTERRDDVGRVRRWRESLAAGYTAPAPVLVDERLPADPVFRAVVKDLGTLPADIAGDVVVFYRYLKAIRFEAVALSRGATEDPVAAADALIALWQEVDARGRQLLEKL